MMNVKLALIVSVSAYALQINPVYASLLSSPPASILDTNIHTNAAGCGKFAAEGLCPEACCSEILLSQAHCRSQTCHKVQSSAHPRVVAHPQGVASLLLVDGNSQNQSSTVILGLDPRIQVAKESLFDLDASVRHWHDSSFLTASVCFITDTGSCSGNSFGGGGSEEYPSGGQPDWNNDQDKKCALEGFHLTSCNSVQEPSNRCPYNENIFEKCVCKPGLVSCSAGQTGIGESCGGKYASCQCRTDLISCNSLQNGQGASCGGKYESCICKPSLVTCTAPNIGVGEACGGKYASCCNNTCQSGYDLNNGSCRQASSIVTGCGNKCYKVLDNSCKSGQLSAPAESGGYKNKIVSYTDCGNPCFQSYNDNCPSGYVKTKSSGKCYETTAKYTDYGTACYKEKACCTDACSGYRTTPSSSQCKWGYNSGKTDCGNPCYTCKDCPSNCPSGSYIFGNGAEVGNDGCGNKCYEQINTWYLCFDFDEGVTAFSGGMGNWQNNTCYDLSGKPNGQCVDAASAPVGNYTVTCEGDRDIYSQEVKTYENGYMPTGGGAFCAYPSYTSEGGRVYIRIHKK